MRWEDTSYQSSAGGRLECSGGSPEQQTGYHIDIGKEEDPTWQTTRWLQLVVQGISDDEVSWYEYVALLMMGTEGTALSLVKCLLAIWWCSARVQGWDVCPPTPTVLNIGQFMTQDEVQGDMDNSLWFKAYSHTLQSWRGCVRSVMAVAEGEGAGGKSLSIGEDVLGGNWHRTHHLLYKTLLGAPAEGCVQEEGEGCYITCDHLPR